MAAPAVGVAVKTLGKRFLKGFAKQQVRRRVQGGGKGPRRTWLIVLLAVVSAFLPIALVVGVGATTMALFAPFGGADEDQALAADCFGQPQQVLQAADGASAVGMGSLDEEQKKNAQTIIATGKQLKVPAYGWVVAIATALQESVLRNIGFGDRDSVGLFQQRAPWGTFDERMDPVISSTKFYTGSGHGHRGLMDVPGWQSMSVTDAAQAVQISGFPYAYADDEPLARRLVELYGDGAMLPGDCGLPPALQCPPTGLAAEDGLTQDALIVIRCLHKSFPEVTTYYGVGERQRPDGDHINGRAVDAMIPDYKSAAGNALGKRVAEFAKANASRMGVEYVIFDAKVWSVARSDEGWRTYESNIPGCTTDNCLHRNHVHVSVFGNAAVLPDTGEWVLPVPPGSYRLTARFGACGARWSNCHTGLDFAAPAGTPARAAAAGTVIYAKATGGAYGNMVKIQHANGVQTYYCHLRSISPGALGASVVPGQMIGEVGTTGNSTGNHLHFETRVDGVAQDPEIFLRFHGVQP